VDRHTQLKNLAMQSSQRNGRAMSMGRNIFSAVLRFDFLILELPQFGQVMASPRIINSRTISPVQYSGLLSTKTPRDRHKCPEEFKLQADSEVSTVEQKPSRTRVAASGLSGAKL
jgi:hypothetical protein